MNLQAFLSARSEVLPPRRRTSACARSHSAMTMSTMVAKIDTGRHQGNLSSAIRLFVLDGLRTHAPRAPRVRIAAELANERPISA